MSKLLFDEQPIVVDRTLAKLIGLNEAIIIQQVHYWITINQKANKNFREGRYWTYNSIRAWHEENFDFWSYDTVKRTIAKLEKLNLLIVGNFNKDKRDQTKWYSINYDVLETLKNPTSAKCTNGKEQNAPIPLVQNAPMEKSILHQPLPEITTENNNTKNSLQRNNSLLSSLEENYTTSSINTIFLSPNGELETERKKEATRPEPIEVDAYIKNEPATKITGTVENALKCTNCTSGLNNNIFKEKNEKTERKAVSTKKDFDMILENSCYEQFSEKNALEQALRLLYFSDKSLKINNMQIPPSQVREDMKKIIWSTIEFAIRDFKIQSEKQEIKYPVGYLSRCIYNAIFQGELKMNAELRYHGLV